MIAWISSFESTLLIRFFSALMTLPRSGRIAWNERSRASTAEPPAELPSTRKSSALSGSVIWQSASLPGSEFDSRALFRRVSSRALRAACRARAAETAFVMICLASVGFSSRNCASRWLTVVFDQALDRRIAELRLRLTLELRIAQLHRDDRSEALANILALEVLLLLLQKTLVARVAVQRAGESRAEPGEVRAALGRVDVVREREDRLDVRRRSTASRPRRRRRRCRPRSRRRACAPDPSTRSRAPRSRGSRPRSRTPRSCRPRARRAARCADRA